MKIYDKWSGTWNPTAETSSRYIQALSQEDKTITVGASISNPDDVGGQDGSDLIQTRDLGNYTAVFMVARFKLLSGSVPAMANQLIVAKASAAPGVWENYWDNSYQGRKYGAVGIGGGDNYSTVHYGEYDSEADTDSIQGPLRTGMGTGRWYSFGCALMVGGARSGGGCNGAHRLGVFVRPIFSAAITCTSEIEVYFSYQRK